MPSLFSCRIKDALRIFCHGFDLPFFMKKKQFLVNIVYVLGVACRWGVLKKFPDLPYRRHRTATMWPLRRRVWKSSLPWCKSDRVFVRRTIGIGGRSAIDLCYSLVRFWWISFLIRQWGSQPRYCSSPIFYKINLRNIFTQIEICIASKRRQLCGLAFSGLNFLRCLSLHCTVMQQMALLIPLNALYLDGQSCTVQLCLILYLNFSTLFFSMFYFSYLRLVRFNRVRLSRRRPLSTSKAGQVPYGTKKTSFVVKF
jgi:hypothetical protein